MCIFIAGAKPTVKDHGAGRLYTCPNCHNEVRFQLSELRTWITLFFVPVIPLGSTFEERCPICSYGGRLSKEDFDERQQSAAQDRQYIVDG